MSQKAIEERTNPVVLFDQPLFRELLGRISHSALVIIMNEYQNQAQAKKHNHPVCTCAASINYGLPCRHKFPEALVPDEINQFWHLDSEEGMMESRFTVK
jgi:hypothetical protein